MKYLYAFLICFCFNTALNADSAHSHHADDHAPIGVMGDHTHKKNEWMWSYRFMQMSMSGNLQGSDSISADDIVTTLANPFSGPPNVRVVPIDMTTNMHMLGVMYAPNDNITLMGMVNYQQKEMDHLTYQGMMGTNILGQFTTKTKGLGDTKLGMLYKLTDQLHLNLTASLPTGSISEEDAVLTPMNTTPTLRLPYAMQLGSGSLDIMPGITYNDSFNTISWGGQATATLRTERNSESYKLGNKLDLSAWIQYRFKPQISGAIRLVYSDQDEITGVDENISAPVQTANPDNYGGEILNLGVGINWVGLNILSGHRIALEFLSPIQQDKNGIQMEMDNMLTVGYQKAF